MADDNDRDVDRVIAEQRYQNQHPRFAGNYEFDMAIEMDGVRVERRARIVYQYAPEWEYFDLHLGKPRTGIGSWVYHIELLTKPAEDCGDELPDDEYDEAEG